MIKEGFTLRQIIGYNIVMSIGAETKNVRGMVLLNGTGALIFEGLKAGKSINQVAGILMTEYDVTRDTAIADIRKTIADLREVGVIE